MPRLSRPESQALTRERLLDTAKTLFLRDGYHPTSIEKVADAAGFSKGAVYSNFRNKDELCMAVLDTIRREESMALMEAFAREATVDGRIHALQAWADKRIGDGQWTPLEMEFSAHARRDPVLREMLADRNAKLMVAVTALVEMQIAELDTKPAMAAAALASAIVTMGIGLGFQRSIDPTVAITGFIESYRVLLTGSRA
jgi:AcrR family transcriptional regulator